MDTGCIVLRMKVIYNPHGGDVFPFLLLFYKKNPPPNRSQTVDTERILIEL